MTAQTPALTRFLERFREAASRQELAKLTLGNRRNRQQDLEKVLIKMVMLKKGEQLSFVYRHATRDLTRNFTPEEAFRETERLLQEVFFNADLFTAAGDFHLIQQPSGKAKLTQTPASQAAKAGIQPHDKAKHRLIESHRHPYLELLGITTAEGKVKNDRQDKFRQINHYVEIIRGLLQQHTPSGTVRVTDMGSGKGYLSFALYDFLVHTLGWKVEMQGIELRPDLVDTCNRIAEACGFEGLRFVQGSIADTPLPATDLLIALHACDTATDDAIYKGIRAGAGWIICAPCCHKEIRRQMQPANILSTLTRHGILLERQAEMVTDGIRALLLESAGYKTSVFDFISTEHTPKNVMIAGIRQAHPASDPAACLQKVQELKALFGIRTQRLETLLTADPNAS